MWFLSSFPDADLRGGSGLLFGGDGRLGGLGGVEVVADVLAEVARDVPRLDGLGGGLGGGRVGFLVFLFPVLAAQRRFAPDEHVADDAAFFVDLAGGLGALELDVMLALGGLAALALAGSAHAGA